MAKPGIKRTITASDPDLHGKDDDAISFDGSVKSSPERSVGPIPVEILEKRLLIPRKSWVFSSIFCGSIQR